MKQQLLLRASLVAQLVKNLHAMEETLLGYLGREDLWRRDRLPTPVLLGFPGGSAGKESPCNSADLDLIPGLGWYPGEGEGYPLQYSWASLVAQLVKNLPAMQGTWLWSLDWDDTLEKGKSMHSSILAWRIPQTIPSSPWGHKESDTTEPLSLSSY